MKFRVWQMFAAAAAALSLQAEVPELTALVPEAKDYELIAKLNPKKWNSEGYQTDRAAELHGSLKRIGYLLKVTDNQDKASWVFVSMDAFAKTAEEAVIPLPGGLIIQDYVTNLEVYSNSGLVKTGKFEKGNVEIWGNNYGGTNVKEIPGATGKFDFGDGPGKDGNYGCLQVHNYLEKETVLAYNNMTNATPDLGIGNNPDPKGQPDWTFSGNSRNFKTAELYIVGLYENLEIRKVTLLDGNKLELIGKTDADMVSYTAGQTMTFNFTLDTKGQPAPTVDYYLKWIRTGDDGKRVEGKVKFVDGKAAMTTSLDQPGFVRVQGSIVRENGQLLRVKRYNVITTTPFDGGAGVEIDKLTSSPEPEDFDAFWTKQKARLAEVPMKEERTEVAAKPAGKIYAVKIDCAGPRPVTGYLTIPAKAETGKVPATLYFQGYGVPRQTPPGDADPNQITFRVNAHGMELNQPQKYYDDFAASIRSNGQTYAFDPKEYATPENAYFCYMAMRVMRALEYVKSLPEWDGKNLTSSGGSQGGLQSVWAAALDPAVSQCNTDVTWCCDLAGAAKMKRLTGGWRVPYAAGVDYFDSVNHAKRIKCPVVITRAGLGDYVCPPSGLAVLYNNITAPKKIFWVQGSDHGYAPSKPERRVIEQK